MKLFIPNIKTKSRTKKQWIKYIFDSSVYLSRMLIVFWAVMIVIPLQEPIQEMFTADPELAGTLGWAVFILFPLMFMRN